MKKKILITGGAGFIGGHLASYLIKKNFKIYIFDDLSTGLKKNIPNKAVFIKGNCAIDKDITKLKNIDFFCIYHLAGQSSGEFSFYNPIIDFNSNLTGTIKIIDLCLKTKNKKIIFSSSMSVYGEAKRRVNENYKADPKSFYGLSKLSAEKYIYKYQKKGLKFTILRLFNVYGPGQNFDNKLQGMVSIYLEQVINNKKLIVKGSKSRFRDFVYIDDVIEILDKVRFKKKCVNETFNVGSGKKYKVIQLIYMILQLFKFNKQNIFYEEGTPDDTYGIYSDNSKIKKAINKSYFTDLEHGIKKTKKKLNI